MSPEVRSRRDHILDAATDLASNFFYYDRKEDEDLPVGAIEEAIRAGEITLDEIFKQFRRAAIQGGVPIGERS